MMVEAETEAEANALRFTLLGLVLLDLQLEFPEGVFTVNLTILRLVLVTHLWVGGDDDGDDKETESLSDDDAEEATGNLVDGEEVLVLTVQVMDLLSE